MISMDKLDTKSSEEINKLFADAWLNLHFKESTLYNPLSHIPQYLEEEPHLYIIWLMQQPDYFSFICKEVFNIQILPMQAVILKEMWNRKFPMLIMVRGGSKSWLLAVYSLLRSLLMPGRRIVICGGAFRQSKIIFNYMEGIWYNAPILRDMVSGSSGSGPYHSPDMFTFRIGESVVNSIPLGDGSKIRGMRAHDIVADEFSCLECNTYVQTSSGLIQIKDYLDGNVHDLLNMNNQFEMPDKIFITPKTDVYKITTQNGYSFKCSNIHKVYTIDGWKIAKDLTTDDYLELTTNDYFPSKYIEYENTIMDEKFAFSIGFRQKILQQELKIILQSPKSVVIQFLRGILFNINLSNFSYYIADKEIVETLQILLLKFGIICLKIEDDCCLVLDEISYNKLCSIVYHDKDIHNDVKSISMKVVSVEKLPEQQVLYDFYLPETHSFYGNGFIQHNSISREVFETVIAGFGVVHSNPVDIVKESAKIKLSERLGLKYKSSTDDAYRANQIIISGTAYYDFNHFGEYWKKWREIIRSKGDKKRLSEVFKSEEIPEDFNWRDYSIIRIPVELIPKGFMDEGMIARSKATIHSGIFEMEYGAVFSRDSSGFFKRSLIESCVIRHDNEITLPSGKVDFRAVLRGDPSKEYVYGVDPASEVDNFAVIILEARSDHSRIIYGWTTTRKDHREKIKAGLVKETDFYCYCARKIRELMKFFPCIRIGMDSQGGGISVIEALHDKDKIEEGEHQIWPIINPEKSMPTDGEPGLHIVDMINFASADWVSEANHGLRKDFEDKVCLFPFFDSATLGLAAIADEKGDRIYDSLEDCVMEIEELKDELSTIIVSQTATGRDKWDTPEIKLPGNKKGRLRKDRYSALLMANMLARQLRRNPAIIYQTVTGGFAGTSKNTSGIEYIGPSWFTEKMKGVYD